MDEPSGLVERFEENRTHLRAVAYRMLGSRTEAHDAVQEAWLRLSRVDSRVSSSRSRLRVGRASQSTYSPTPSACAGST